ncbi:low temperature requirement protein A [Nocardia yunnanensis]|uniref:Low temperature requirement protein A n=1 Tax=Nocardia yunnanensis TaxID=2382165 RepID=A0A386Z5P6_9NOCA|nr:low temperature requirement protein A [Nocardia yunnanensis]AYF73092.1 low temperature requirement protein A [Nocardia yunnanensis]
MLDQESPDHRELPTPTPAYGDPAAPASTPPGESTVARRATWFELFGDLVFVAAVGQITHRVGAHPGAGSVAAAAGLFVPLWWAWVLYAVHANRADRDTVAHRLLTGVGLTGVVGMAVFAGGVGQSRGVDAGFVLSYLGARTGVAALYAWDSRRDPGLIPVFRSFTVGSVASAIFWLGGLACDGGWRYGAWAVAMLMELALPLVAGRRLRRVTQETEHLRERFGLFTIIVLGESVLGFTNGLAAAHTAGWAALTAAAAFALTVGLWWSYFNGSGVRPGSHTELARPGKLLHAFTFGHLPMLLGLALTGASMGIAVTEGGAHLNATAGACIVGGVIVYLVSVALVRAAFTGIREAVVVIRLLTAVLAAALLPVATRIPVAGLLTALAVLVIGSVVVETPAQRRRAAAA